jgi:Tfp pilus assembly protein PilV
MNRKNPQFRRGFLLMEAMIATVILAVAAVGVVDLLLSAQQQQQALQQNATAVLLARQLMEEIASKPFGPSTSTVPRAQITYANQYNGYSDSTGAMSTLGGVSVEPGNGEAYSRTVLITTPTISDGAAAPASDRQLITVTVTTPEKQTVTLTRLLTNVTWP